MTDKQERVVKAIDALLPNSAGGPNRYPSVFDWGDFAVDLAIAAIAAYEEPEPEMSIIEKMAKAFKEAGWPNNELSWEDFADYQREHYIVGMKAALAVMLKESFQRIDAAGPALPTEREFIQTAFGLTEDEYNEIMGMNMTDDKLREKIQEIFTKYCSSSAYADAWEKAPDEIMALLPEYEQIGHACTAGGEWGICTNPECEPVYRKVK